MIRHGSSFAILPVNAVGRFFEFFPFGRSIELPDRQAQVEIDRELTVLVDFFVEFHHVLAIFAIAYAPKSIIERNNAHH